MEHLHVSATALRIYMNYFFFLNCTATNGIDAGFLLPFSD